MKLFGRVLRFLVLAVAIFLCAIPVAELGRRGWERLIWLRDCVKCEGGTDIMGVRLNQRLWKMFLGEGARDLRVLPGNQSTAILLPPEGHWQAVDFLLPEKLREKNKFTVTSDSYGFRGNAQKVTSRSFKVLVLGSYQAFGHGVNDQETYSARLLELLKKSKVLRDAGLTPVVWNGGMQSAALDRGVEVLRKYGEELKPNIVILDYGMTDQVKKGLNPWLQPFAALADQNGGLYRRLDDFTRAHSTSFFGKLYLFTDMVNRGMQRNFPLNRSAWEQEMESLLRGLKGKGVKVLMLNQPVAGMPDELYRRVAGRFSHSDFLNVPELLNAAAARLPPGEADPEWLEEFPPPFRSYYRRRAPFCVFLGNILHINARGHLLVAQALSDWVEKHSTP